MQSAPAVQNPRMSKSPRSFFFSCARWLLLIDTLVGEFGWGSLHILIGATVDEGFVAHCRGGEGSAGQITTRLFGLCSVFFCSLCSVLLARP